MKTLAIIVNYQAADLAAKAAFSLLDSESLGPLRIVLVDNSCDPAETGTLRRKLPESVEMMSSSTNLGFGNACNLAVARYPGEFILLLNPDARLLPGSLVQLQTTLRNRAAVAAVAPQLYWDDELRYLLPPAYPVCLFVADLFRLHHPAGRLLSHGIDKLWKCYALGTWSSKSEKRMLNLSGAAVLIRRSALERQDQLFDPGFFLYFEDSDLFFRMRRSGHPLLMNPRAKAVHYYDQCGRNEWIEKRVHMLRAKRLFLSKHYPFLMKWNENPGAQPPAASLEAGDRQQPHFSRPFLVPVPATDNSRWLFELSPHPDFIPAIGFFGRGRTLVFRDQDWNRLAPGTYYGRVGPARGCARHFCRFTWQVPDCP